MYIFKKNDLQSLGTPTKMFTLNLFKQVGMAKALHSCLGVFQSEHHLDKKLSPVFQGTHSYVWKCSSSTFRQAMTTFLQIPTHI
jgi:hypothetical protein